MWCRDQCLCYHTKSFHFNNSSQHLTSAYLHIILDISSVLCRLTIDMDYWLWPGLLQVGTTAHSVPALVWRNKTSDSMLQHHNSQTCKQCLTMLKCESIQYCPTVKIYADKCLILIDLESVKALWGTFNYEKVLEMTSPSIALSILNIVKHCFHIWPQLCVQIWCDLQSAIWYSSPIHHSAVRLIIKQ